MVVVVVGVAVGVAVAVGVVVGVVVGVGVAVVVVVGVVVVVAVVVGVVMKFEEVLPALRAGKKARLATWGQGHYVQRRYVHSNDLLNENFELFDGLSSVVMLDTWEVVEGDGRPGMRWSISASSGEWWTGCKWGTRDQRAVYADQVSAENVSVRIPSYGHTIRLDHDVDPEPTAEPGKLQLDAVGCAEAYRTFAEFADDYKEQQRALNHVIGIADSVHTSPLDGDFIRNNLVDKKRAPATPEPEVRTVTRWACRRKPHWWSGGDGWGPKENRALYGSRELALASIPCGADLVPVRFRVRKRGAK